MKRELAGNIAFDTGPILDLLYSTKGGLKVKEALKAEKLQIHISQVTLAELGYILCRKMGLAESRTRIKNLQESGYLSVHDHSKLTEIAAEYKCKRALSLADCFAIALAKTMGEPLLFSKKESELAREMSKETFDVEVWFLEDFI